MYLVKDSIILYKYAPRTKHKYYHYLMPLRIISNCKRGQMMLRRTNKNKNVSKTNCIK